MFREMSWLPSTLVLQSCFPKVVDTLHTEGTNAYTVNKTLFSLRWRLPLGLASTPAFAGKGWLKAWLCGPLDPLGVLGVHSCYFS